MLYKHVRSMEGNLIPKVSVKRKGMLENNKAQVRHTDFQRKWTHYMRPWTKHYQYMLPNFQNVRKKTSFYFWSTCEIFPKK